MSSILHGLRGLLGRKPTPDPVAPTESEPEFSILPDGSPICIMCGHHFTYHLSSLDDNPLMRCIADNCTCHCAGFQ